MPTARSRWSVAAVALAWACAKATSSDLAGGSYSPFPDNGGGTGARGGAGGTGGTFFAGGSAGTGTGGGAARGGTGGSSAAGGTTASGGTGVGDAGADTGGTGGNSAQGGSGGVPPDVLKNAQVVLYYQARNTETTADRVDMRLFIQNKADTALELSHVEVRYWMTAEATPVTHSYYAAAGMHLNQPPEFVSDGDDSYLDFTFGAGGEVPAHNTDLNATEFQGTIDTTGGNKFDQSNDWSFDASLASDPQPNPKITVYLGGTLIWGCEPSGKCPDTGGGEAGAGGEGGEPATSGTGGATGSGGTGGAAGATGEAGMAGQAGA